MPLLTGKMEAVSLTDVISSPSPSAPASRFSRAKSPTTNEEISRTSYATAVDHALTPRYSARALDNQTQVYKTSKDYTQSRDLPNSLKWFYREKSELLVTRDVVGKLVATSTQKHNDTADKDYCFKLPADVSNYGGTNKVKGQIKTQQGTICYCPSPQNSLYSASVYAEARQSFTQTEVSERCSSSIEELTESTDASNCDDNLVESGKTSTGSDISGESSISAVSSAMYKPHMANDTRWESIRVIRCREGALGFNHFRLLTRLGKGDIGEVHLAELTGTKGYFAMKIMNKSELAGRKKLLRAQTEREILQCLDHPFLPTLYAHFETESSSCLVMEFCPGGDLHALRQRQTGKYFPEHAARFYVAEVLLALEYLHMLGIIYRDLKPENVLVREDGHIMLSDFDLSLRCTVSPTLVKSSNSNAEPKNSGYCVQPSCMQPSCLIQPACFSPRFLSNKPKKDKKRRQKHDIHLQVCPLPELMAEPTGARSMSFVGTHEYLAPEIIKGEGHGSAVDWWTFGIFLYELLFGRTPFKGHDNKATLFNIVGQPLRFPETPNVSFAARDLIRGLLAKEPQHRLAYRRGATEVKQHTFFQNVNWALIRCANPPDVPKPVTLDFLARSAEMNPIMEKNVADIDVQPCGNYLDIDFF